MMKWIDASGTMTMGDLMMSLVVTLREQLATSAEQMDGLVADTGASDEEFNRTAQAFLRARRQR